MHFLVTQLFSIAIITDTCVHHIWNLRPMNGQIYYAQKWINFIYA